MAHVRHAGFTRPLLEALEDRLAPAVQLTFTTGNASTLTLVNTAAELAEVFLTQPAPGVLDVAVSSNSEAQSVFTADSTANGVSYSNPGNPAASNSAAVAIGTTSPVMIQSTGLRVEVNSSISLSNQDLTIAGGPITIGLGDTVATNGGNLTLNGSAAGPNLFYQGEGVYVPGATLDAGGGNISITGFGSTVGDPGTQGVVISQGSHVQTSGGGTIDLNGFGGSGSINGGSVFSSSGVVVTGTGTLVTTANGKLSIEGTVVSPGAGTFEDGIEIVSGAHVTTTGTGNIILMGTGNSQVTSGHSYGVDIEQKGTLLQTNNGSISITGIGGQGKGTDSAGVHIAVDATGGNTPVDAGGAGTVTIIGTAMQSTGSNSGVELSGPGAEVMTSEGNVSVTGTGAGDSAGTCGIKGTGGAVVQSGGSGNVNLIGIAPGDFQGIAFDTSGSGVIANGTGDVVLSGNVIDLGAADSVSGVGKLFFQPLDPARSLQIGGSDTAGHLVFTDTDALALEFFKLLILGSATGNAPITTGADTNFNTDVLIQAPGTSGSITVTNQLDVGANNLTLTSGGPVSVLGSGGQLLSTKTGSITVTGTGNSASNTGITVTGTIAGGGVVTLTGIGALIQSADGVRLDMGGVVKSLNNNVVITGTGGSVGGANDGVYIGGDSQVATDGVNSTVAITGTGGAGPGDGNGGVVVTGAGSLVTSSSGNVFILLGQGGGSGTSQNNDGVEVADGGVISAGGTGQVSVQGTGGASSGDGNVGVVVTGAGSQITSSGGNVFILKAQGGGSGTSQNNVGVVVANGGVITAGGTGQVSVEGTGGAATGNDNLGVLVADAGSQITSGGGNVIVTGQGGGAGASAQNDGVAVGVLAETQGGTITAGAGGTVTIKGTGGATSGDADFGIDVENGGVVSSGAGGLGTTTVQLTGNGGGGAGGSNCGIQVSGAGSRVISGGGNVVLIGTGGGDVSAAPDNFGVLIQSGGVVTAGTGGGAAVHGTGGASQGNGNVGVCVLGSGSQVTSGGGDVVVTGQGGGAGGSADNAGIQVGAGGQIRATGNGTVNIQGLGGSGDGSVGTLVSGAGSQVTSGGGEVTVRGAGGLSGSGVDARDIGVQVGAAGDAGGTITSEGAGPVSVLGGGGINTGNDNYGIDLEAGGVVSSGGSGLVTLEGDGGLGVGNNNIGVVVNGADAQVTSGGGAVMVTGKVGNPGDVASNFGVGVEVVTGTITSGGGNVTVVGTGGASTGDSDVGLLVTGAAARVSSGGGNVELTGQGGGTGAATNGAGVVIEGGSVVTAGGSGTVSVTGTGGAGSGSGNIGVNLQINGAKVTSGGGNIAIVGHGGGTGVKAFGINIEAGATVAATGTATLTLTGTAAPDADTAAITFDGLGLGFGSGSLSTAAGDLTLNGDVIDLGDANSVSTSGAARLFFQPMTADRAIQLGGNDVTGTLVFSDQDRAAIKDGFSLLTIGIPTGTGAVTTASDLTPFTSNVTVLTPETDGGGIILSNTLDDTGHTLTLKTGGGIQQATGGLLKADNLVLQAGTGAGTDAGPLNTAVGALVAQATTGGVFLTNEGDLAVGFTGSPFPGVTAPSVTGAIAITSSGALVVGQEVSAGSGGVTLQGTGSVDSINGVTVTAATVYAAGGNVTLTGTGQSGNGGAFGVLLQSGAHVQTDAGTITLTGAGGAAGIDVFGSTVDAGGGNVVLSGTGASAASLGIEVEHDAVVETSGTGTVALNGSAPGAAGNSGVLVTGGGRITAGAGDATLSLGLQAGSSLAVGLNAQNGTGSGFAFVHVDGGVNLGGASLQVTNTGGTSYGTVFTIVQTTGGVSGRFAGLANNAIFAAGGRTFRIAYTTNAVTLADVTLGPIVISVSPPSGPTAGSTPVTITGKALGTPSTATVDFGPGNPGKILSDDGSTIMATSPSGTAGTVDVTVTVAGVTSLVSPPADQFTFVAPALPRPAVNTVSPASGSTAGGMTVTITGTMLGTASTATVTFGRGNPGKILSDNGTTIVAVSPPGVPGAVDVTVSVAGVGSLANPPADTFTFVAPVTPPTPPQSPSGTAPADLTPSQHFVTNLYQDLLGRAPDAGGLAGFSALLDGNQASRSQIILAIEYSPEAESRQVGNLYQTLLGRPAAPGEVGLWVAYLGQGASLADVRADLLGSDEYFQRQGGNTPAGFVAALYRDLLGRAPSTAEVQEWTLSLAAGTSRAAVALALESGPEYAQDEVRQDFQTYLRRAPGAAELATYAALLEAGVTNEVIVSLLAGSDEYFGRG